MDDEERRKSIARARLRKCRAIKVAVKQIMEKRGRHQFHEGCGQAYVQNQEPMEVADDLRPEFDREYREPRNLDDEVPMNNEEQPVFDNDEEAMHDRIDLESIPGDDDEHQIDGMPENNEVLEQVEVLNEDNGEENDEVPEQVDAFNNDNHVAPLDEAIQIRKWAIANNIHQKKLDGLLAILRRRLLPDLPKSSKTFLNTSSAIYDIRVMESADGSTGEFVYFGILEGLRQTCIGDNVVADNRLLLQFNVDGMTLYNSSVKQFWPILCKIHSDSIAYKPFPVAIYCGDSKPSSVDLYLQEFIAELNGLLAGGIEIMGRHCQVYIHSFICDTPARSFLKCTKGHGGFWACERCETRGERVSGRTIYPDMQAQERTDRSFRLQTQPEHHSDHSPLLGVEPPINLVKTFVLDSMHLICMGIPKKLIEYWIAGKNTPRLYRRNKLGLQQRKQLSRRLLMLKHCIPVEFQRKPKNMSRFALWKATEFRFFLLYAAPIVLKGILSPRLYRHFLLLHTACRILCTKELILTFNSHAKIYLRKFFSLIGDLYGRQSQIMNVHNLIHIADDVVNMNCTLSMISAFPFENLLGKIKLLLRNANRPLAQLCRRLHEAASIAERPSNPEIIQILRSQSRPNELRISVIKLKYRGFILTTKKPNNLVILDNNVIVVLTKMTSSREDLQDVQIEGYEWKVKSSIFNYPTPSSGLKMWELVREFSDRIKRCNVRRVNRKMVQLIMNEQNRTKMFAIPFLHE